MAKKKVKSGCQTCKIRKVKCDEGRPACYRCVSTGRACDGYGIWGGGSVRQQQRRPVPENEITRPPASNILAGSKELGYFEWFKCRTATKVQGTYLSGFWSSLLFQASQREPAVLHAVLAVSSMHKRGVFSKTGGIKKINSIPDDQEQYSLQQFSKAVDHLRPHFSNSSKESCRVALITCVLFISLDLFRGHFQTAQVHLQRGLDVIKEQNVFKDGTLYVQSANDMTDDCIIEAFVRLHLQMELFKYSHPHPCIAFQTSETFADELSSFNMAWRYLQQIFNDIFRLAEKSRQQDVEYQFPHHPPGLSEQKRIRAELLRWFSLYNTFQEGLRAMLNDEKVIYKLLGTYHVVATIMNETCLWPNDESIYDLFSDDFVLLSQYLSDMWILARKTHAAPAPDLIVDMARSTIDTGWLPLLYYAATKCRIHRIRLHATMLIEKCRHREGFWDAKSTACIARKVMEMEEGDFYQSLGVVDDIDLCSHPTQEDILLPPLPESHRIRHLEPVLLGTPLHTISLYGRLGQGNDTRTLLAEYSVPLQEWKDVQITC